MSDVDLRNQPGYTRLTFHLSRSQCAITNIAGDPSRRGSAVVNRRKSHLAGVLARQSPIRSQASSACTWGADDSEYRTRPTIRTNVRHRTLESVEIGSGAFRAVELRPGRNTTPPFLPLSRSHVAVFAQKEVSRQACLVDSACHRRASLASRLAS
jgi:hypothetical protein